MPRTAPVHLTRGDQPPAILHTPPGPAVRALARRLSRHEAPGINTLVEGTTATVWREALGANVLDADGNVFVDLTAGFGVAAVGHRHPEVIAAIRTQAGRLLHGLGDVHAHLSRIELSEQLAGLVPLDDPQVYYAISGADAVEIAIKTAQLVTSRPGVLAFDPAYHGLTLGALALTSRPEFRRPFAPHLSQLVRRLPYGAAIDEVVNELRRHDVGAVVVEPIVGREGVLLPPPRWLSDLASCCRDLQVLLIVDEIFTGFGRTGEWFAVEHDAVRPDLLCCGKALGGGLPIGAVVGRRDVLSAWPTDGEALHTATFVANPVACAAASAVLRILQRDGLIERARTLGARLGARLREIASTSALVSEVRGRGLLWGLELVDAAAAKEWMAAATRMGVLVLAGGAQGRVLQVVPPLSIAQEQLEVALVQLSRALGEVSSHRRAH